MKTGDSAARDGDEHKWKNLSGENRSRPIRELRKRGHLERRQHDQNSERERNDNTDLYERGQIIPRREEQPNRKNRCRKSVRHYQECKRASAQREHRRKGGILGDPSSRIQRNDQQYNAD